jgi:hypothetical protein
MDTRKTDIEGEPGKVGMAFLLWLLGVPGFLILAYLLFT